MQGADGGGGGRQAAPDIDPSTGAGAPPPDRLMARLAAQSLQVLVVEFQPVVTLKDRDQPTASKARIIQVDLVQKPLAFQVFGTLRHRLICDWGSRLPGICIVFSCSIPSDFCLPDRRVPLQNQVVWTSLFGSPRPQPVGRSSRAAWPAGPHSCTLMLQAPRRFCACTSFRNPW